MRMIGLITAMAFSMVAERMEHWFMPCLPKVTGRRTIQNSWGASWVCVNAVRNPNWRARMMVRNMNEANSVGIAQINKTASATQG